MVHTLSSRARAVQIIKRIIEKKIPLQECFVPEDTPFIYQLVYGTMRFYHSLCAMRNMALKAPLPAKDNDIAILIIVGIYQLQHLRVSTYAAVNETVAVADFFKKSWAKSLINAILRRFLREREFFETQCTLSEEAFYSHPQWLIDWIKSAWSQQWEAILQANNEKPPMHLRVNRLKISREAYLQYVDAKPMAMSSDGLILNEPMDVEKLPGFEKGWISVQDASSQAVVHCLDLQPNQRILDACAAPGGKTCHMLEREPSLKEVVAMDISSERLLKVKENLSRLQLKATVLCADAASPASWWDGQEFERILLDAPCSATGVIRRHPDIKCLRTPADIEFIIQKQQEILEALWPLLAENGLLVYTTCSILPEENKERIASFLQQHPEAKLRLEKQILPGDVKNEDHADGFFYAVLQKASIAAA